MTLKQQDTQLVNLAIQQTAALLLLLNPQDADFIIRELFFNVWCKFREHQRRLSSLQIMEIADYEFDIRANGHSKGTLLIERKGEKFTAQTSDSKVPRSYNGWTTLQVKFLEENYNFLTVEQIGKALNRNRDSIFYMAQKLGLKKDKKFFSRRKKEGGANA